MIKKILIVSIFFLMTVPAVQAQKRKIQRIDREVQERVFIPKVDDRR